jgi:hypothetical protein
LQFPHLYTIGAGSVDAGAVYRYSGSVAYWYTVCGALLGASGLSSWPCGTSGVRSIGG